MTNDNIMEKDTIYTIYIQDIPCRDTLSSKEKAIYIKNKLDAIELKPRFKNYIIYLQYKCYNYVNYKYECKRNYKKWKGRTFSTENLKGKKLP